MVIASYGNPWEYVSPEHERIAGKVSDILNRYAIGKTDHLSYAIIGTFGAGKTQLLYHIHRLANAKDLLPLYSIAEDLFREALLNSSGTFTPGTIFSFMQKKIEAVKAALASKNSDEVWRILDPRGKLKSDAAELLESVIGNFLGKQLSTTKAVLLVDELEGQYGILQERVLTKDRSPLREWLEDRTHLKFLAFAPAGIYELGGADRDRVKRIVLPPVDIEYVRKKVIDDPGKSNSCWWLSRGKVRQLFKAAEVLKERHNLDAGASARVIKTQLDYIGQSPTQVPPAFTDAVPPSKVSCLLNLRPTTGDKARRYVISTPQLDVGALADALVEAFHIRKDNAILIAEYFKRTAKALSDEHGVTYIHDADLPELFSLTLDHLLEYEHGSPEISSSIAEILALYERVRSETPALYGIVGRTWELKETEWSLPLAISEVRKAFPFPSMNPIVKNYLPTEMRKKFEGRGFPLWRWGTGNITLLFFISRRDLAGYVETDEFLSLALPDGKGVLCLLPTGEGLTVEKALFSWLGKTEKIRIVEVPPLLTDFLLSASGDIEEPAPADLQTQLGIYKQSKEDILLSRRAEIYGEAINEIARANLPGPKTFERGEVPDAKTVWGTGQMDRDVAVLGTALSFVDSTAEAKRILADLRELFRSGKEGRGSGDLNPLMPRGGYITLCDDLLPRYGRKKELRDSEPIGRLNAYWKQEERNLLIELARILPLPHFLKLHSEDNMNRLLQSLWKPVRKDFDFRNLEPLIQKFDRDFNIIISDCRELEREARSSFRLNGINFEEKETIVKASDGMAKLVGLAKEAAIDSSASGPIVKAIITTLMNVLSNQIEKAVTALALSSNKTKEATAGFTKSADNLRKNFWEYPRASKFLGIADSGIELTIRTQANIGGSKTLQEFENAVRERKQYLDDVSHNLGQLEKKLDELERLFVCAKETL